MTPLEEDVSFKAKVQSYNRIQIPVEVRWLHRLEPGELFRVRFRIGFRSEKFYARMSQDGRLTIPKVIIGEFLDAEDSPYALAGYTAKVTLYPVHRDQDRTEKET